MNNDLNHEPKGRILVVDDEKMTCFVLRELLMAANYQVEEAYDGEDALDKYASFKPDLILLDLMMPKLNGFSVCQEINKKDKDTIILIVSAKSFPADIKKAKEMGAHDYILKPFNSQKLLQLIASKLKRVPA